MVFKTTGNKSNSVILFFHAMGVTGESSIPVAEKMAEKYYCIMPTSTVYCSGQRYQSKRDGIKFFLTDFAVCIISAIFCSTSRRLRPRSNSRLLVDTNVPIPT